MTAMLASTSHLFCKDSIALLKFQFFMINKRHKKTFLYQCLSAATVNEIDKNFCIFHRQKTPLQIVQSILLYVFYFGFVLLSDLLILLIYSINISICNHHKNDYLFIEIIWINDYRIKRDRTGINK